MQFISLAVLGKRIKALRLLLKDKNVSFGKKALVVFGIVYLCLPVDLIPPIIPVFGFLDDLILWLFILNYLSEELDKYWIGDPDIKVKHGRKKYRGKNVVDGVEYEVHEEGTEERPETDRDYGSGEEGPAGNGGTDENEKINLEKER